ncbi:DUF2614 family zinc ribbon-containing protein [Succinimonas amylolytica]|uniref:DUF2614 family zinc ribbon-containing protein n=1 Tax=Succinimonas amylolytica TaxID=83769 RepID=UPI00036430A7|nr:DUF2614 family zinc ribbon-containing protein [Succinimonas amylolytica]
MKKFRDPRLNRMAGYVILFTGFGILAFGSSFRSEADPYNWKFVLLFLVSMVFLIYSLIWMIKTVRCPHCNSLLHLKLRNIDVCPWCKYPTDPDDPVYRMNRRTK